ncbi:MAG: hypothetical protein ACFFCS_01620 [Candidatus Hodarchaeota archaeon]
MESTVVGSFPLENTRSNFELALKDQIKSGITIPCYPQLVDMNHQFLLPLSDLMEGLYLENKEFHFKGKFELPSEVVAIEYGKTALEILEENEDLKRKISGLKACLTGPFTLSSNIILENEGLKEEYKPLLFKEIRGHLVPDVLTKIASYIAEITKEYKKMGFKIISIDDPFLSQLVGRRKILFHEREFVLKILNEASKNLSSEASLHVCGVISPKLRDLLLDAKIRYLDHEFKTSPKNFEIYDKEILEKHDKILAFGSIQTNPVPQEDKPIESYIETVEEVEKALHQAKEKFGESNLIIKPDCGFSGMVAFNRLEQGLGYKIAIKKLEVMNKAKNNVFK